MAGHAREHAGHHHGARARVARPRHVDGLGGAAAPTAEMIRPLADRMRPRTLDEFVGQKQLLAPGKPLRQAIEGGQLHSLILWGPPGTGQDHARAHDGGAIERAVHRALRRDGGREGHSRRRRAGEGSARAETGKPTVLFLDEVHRFNKAQQDTFLPYLEDGTLHLHRRHDGESFVRSGQRASLPRARVCAALPAGGGHRRRAEAGAGG